MIFCLCFPCGTMTDLADSDVAIGDGIGGEVEGIDGVAVLQDEDVGRIGVGSSDPVRSRSREVVAIIAMLHWRINVFWAKIVVIGFGDGRRGLARGGSEWGVTATAGGPDTAAPAGH